MKDLDNYPAWNWDEKSEELSKNYEELLYGTGRKCLPKDQDAGKP